MTAKYVQPVAGGIWEHRSCDCPEHGDNLPAARPYKSLAPYTCRACLLGLPSARKPNTLEEIQPKEE